MEVKRIYTAWDNRKDEQRLFAGGLTLGDTWKFKYYVTSVVPVQ